MEVAPDHPGPRRKAANLTVRVDLLQIAREDNLNLSAMLEKCLLEYCKERRGAQWVAENREGIEAYNERIERNGVFASKHRRF